MDRLLTNINNTQKRNCGTVLKNTVLNLKNSVNNYPSLILFLPLALIRTIQRTKTVE